MKLLVLIGLVSFSLTTNSTALLQRGGDASGGTAGPSEVTIDEEELREVAAGSGVDCTGQDNEENGYQVSLDFIKTLVHSSIPEDDVINFSKIGGTPNYRLEINDIVTACTDFEYAVQESNDRKNYFMSIKNKYAFSEDSDFLQYLWDNEDTREHVTRTSTGSGEDEVVRFEVNESFLTMSHDRKHSLCLQSKGLVDSGRINHSAARESGHHSPSESFIVRNVDIRSTNDESVNLYFASGINTRYAPSVEEARAEAERVPRLHCRRVENFGGQEPYRIVVSERDRIIDEYREACHRGDVEAMVRAERELNSTGNFTGLQAQMETITTTLRNRRANEIFASMEEINRELGQSGLDREEVKSLVNSYMDEMRELGEIALEPAQARIRNSVLNRRSYETQGEYEEAIEPHVDILDRFASLVDGEHNNVHEALRNNLDAEAAEMYADIVTEGAEAASHIREARLSLRVRDGRYPQTTSGRRNIRDNIRSHTDQVVAEFEQNELRTYRLQFRIYEGDRGVVDNALATTREIEAEINSGFMAYQQREQEEYNRSCARGMLGGPRNSYLCNRYPQERARREAAYMDQREAQLLRLRAAREEFDSFRNLFNQSYVARVESGETRQVEEEGYSLLSLTRNSRNVASELPTLEDGRPIEDYYSFTHQQEYMRTNNPGAIYQAPPQHWWMQPHMQQGMQGHPGMYMNPAFMGPNPYGP